VDTLLGVGAAMSGGSATSRDLTFGDALPRRIEADGTTETLRVGLMDGSTLVVADAAGAVSTLTRGGASLEAAPDLDATVDLSALHEVEFGTCSETGRWPASALGDVTWMPWSACADFVSCAPPRMARGTRRPLGLRASLSIRGALDGTTSASTVVDAVGVGPQLAGQRVTGLVSLLLTLRFDPRAVARERLASSLTSRREDTPLGVDVVNALGAETARALVSEGAP
jgi:hypothetical protein